MTWQLVLLALTGYLIGSLPTGYLIARTKGIDIRKYGSGGTGGTNVLRTVGVAPAAITAVVDILKGTLAYYLGLTYGGPWGGSVTAVAAVAAHSWPVWLNFRGGKSVGTAVGALFLFAPLTGLAALGAFLVTVALTRFVSLGSLLGSTVALVLVLYQGDAAQKVFLLLAWAVVFIRQNENIKRLMAGKENKLGQKAQPRT